MKNRRFIFLSALTGALYVVLCAICMPISFGPLQLRISEILCILSVDYLWAIPGLSLGCLLSNLLIGGLGVLDIVFGTSATLLGCLLAYLFKKIRFKNLPILSASMIVLTNAVIVGTELGILYEDFSLIPLMMVEVGAGELIAMVLALLLYKKLVESINKLIQ